MDYAKPGLFMMRYGTPVVGLCAMIAPLIEVGLAIYHKDLDHAAHAFEWALGGAALTSMLIRQKHIHDVANEAAAQATRAAPGPNLSEFPAVQREIDKHERASRDEDAKLA